MSPGFCDPTSFSKVPLIKTGFRPPSMLGVGEEEEGEERDPFPSKTASLRNYRNAKVDVVVGGFALVVLRFDAVWF